ncbi:unnamed protein product [Enterobius vermicularis]|uniref:Ribonucleoside-diphosphate reductase n=1 Tax=Enterobius vermicularis TaxID=51028 RepID=A0A0N4UUS2_ENTVE|nr:unnamed protein product [Enterobius vermicularis]
MLLKLTDGREEVVRFDKIASRIEKLSEGLDKDYVDPIEVAQTVITGLFPGITTTQLDELAAEAAANLIGKHPDYGLLASRIAVSNLHKNTASDFSEVIGKLFNVKAPRVQKDAPLVSKSLYDLVQANKERFNSIIRHDRDYLFNFFAIRKLEEMCLLKIDGVVIERPQHMFLRVALSLNGDDLDAAVETYDLISEHWYSYEISTLCNSGMPRPQMASSFSVIMQEDSIDGIFETVKKCALISRCSGKIGLAVHNIRSTGSPIFGTCGVSNGLIPMLRVFNSSVRYIDQGACRRPGAVAIYLEPWHADVMQTFELKKKVGDELERCRELNFALWVPDLFMRRVKENGKWSLMCPAECPGLEQSWGEEFEKLYTKYEEEGRFRKQLDARKVWETIVTAQIETGMPYILYKDACNRKSNQKNLGTLKCSSMDADIVQFCTSNESALCEMASIAVNKFVTAEKEIDYQLLHETTKKVTYTLNKMIDVNYYPLSETELSAKRHRAIGIGVQGLADAFLLMRCPFTSPKARNANRKVFETVYHGALEASCELAVKDGPYETFKGSPASEGLLQFDMWGVKPSDQWDWERLKLEIVKHGLRNSLVTAQMPAASSGQLLGSNEGVQPYMTNVYSRHLSTDFQIFNPHLAKDLFKLGLWDEEMRVDIVVNKGSIREISRIPSEIRELYKTDLIDMAVDRAPFIDHSQSLDVYIANPTFANCTSMHFYGWEKGLKTGLRYLKTRSALESEIHFSTEKARVWEEAVKKHETEVLNEAITCAR